MLASRYWPILGVAIAIAITSTMDATGLSVYSALPLAPLLGIFWSAQRMSRRQVGFAWGRGKDYLLPLLYPFAIAGSLSGIAAFSGVLDLSHANWRKAWINFAITAIATVLVAVITEEGFFRGWLWASLERIGAKSSTMLIFSSIAFSLWHWSAVMLNTGFNPPRRQVPIFMVNAAVIGAIWGVMRWRSGSVIVSSVSHGVWNGMAYVLFGFGTKTGALGIKQTWLLGPEVGIVGLLLNGLFLFVLLRWRSSAGQRRFEVALPAAERG